MLYYELLEPGESVTGKYYSLQLNHLTEKIQEKRPYTERWRRPVILQHSNAKPHRSSVGYQTINELRSFTAFGVLPGHCDVWLSPISFVTKQLSRAAISKWSWSAKNSRQFYLVNRPCLFSMWDPSIAWALAKK